MGTIVEQTQLLGLIRGRGPQANKRAIAEDVLETNGSIRRSCRLLFGLLVTDAYIGRMYEYLLLLVNFKVHLATPMILYHALDIAGSALKAKYPGPIK